MPSACVHVQEDPTLITDIRADLQEECGKFGTVKKILLFDVTENCMLIVLRILVRALHSGTSLGGLYIIRTIQQPLH